MNREVSIRGEVSVLEVALNNKIHIETSCGGSGSCGACRVWATGLNLSPRTDVELAMAEDRGFSTDERLACQLEPQDGLIIRIPDYSAGDDEIA